MSASRLAKAVAFTAQASEHHNEMKIRSVLKWLKTGHEVRIQITGKADRQRAMEAIYKQLEKEAKSGAKFLQKVIKPESIKVTLRPTEEAANYIIDDSSKTSLSVDKELELIMSDKDIFSDEFEQELDKSINEEKGKKTKR